MGSMEQRLRLVEERISKACAFAGRARSDVALVAVSKRHSGLEVDEALALGVAEFGENYVQEALEKFPRPSANLHFIGSLQKNKVRKILPISALVHGVSSLSVLEAMERVAAEEHLTSEFLLQLHLTEEPTKSRVRSGGTSRSAGNFRRVPSCPLAWIHGDGAFGRRSRGGSSRVRPRPRPAGGIPPGPARVGLAFDGNVPGPGRSDRPGSDACAGGNGHFRGEEFAVSAGSGFLAELATAIGSAGVFALLARQILSFRRWSSETTLFRALETLTEPWLSQVRRHLPRGWGIDLSPWVAVAMGAALTFVLRLLLSRGSS
jgi:uncharacterized protein YggT (Ycf19 family)